MNERIRELVGQAKFMAEETVNKQISKNAELDAFAEKFALLIVRECLEQGKQIQSHTIIGCSEDYISGREMGIEVFMNQIKEHFGVEE